MYLHEVQIRVRYADTDQMGYVYYGNYAAYYEVARVEAFRALGYAYKQLEADGIMMPVLELKTKYHQPARYDDLLTIKVSIPEYPRVRIRYEYEIFNESNELLNTGETTLVFISKETGKPTRIPAVMLDLLEPHY
ncbi:MAG: acyl-CoA thioesterase [Cyclobacteriaceae bacterium]|nr:acyl-CoA thioesterase [Cyclobacteriaceae bacterium HetDA_MAG_MS6]